MNPSSPFALLHTDTYITLFRHLSLDCLTSLLKTCRGWHTRDQALLVLTRSRVGSPTRSVRFDASDASKPAEFIRLETLINSHSILKSVINFITIITPLASSPTSETPTFHFLASLSRSIPNLTSLAIFLNQPLVVQFPTSLRHLSVRVIGWCFSLPENIRPLIPLLTLNLSGPCSNDLFDAIRSLSSLRELRSRPRWKEAEIDYFTRSPHTLRLTRLDVLDNFSPVSASLVDKFLRIPTLSILPFVTSRASTLCWLPSVNQITDLQLLLSNTRVVDELEAHLSLLNQLTKLTIRLPSRMNFPACLALTGSRLIATLRSCRCALTSFRFSCPHLTLADLVEILNLGFPLCEFVYWSECRCLHPPCSRYLYPTKLVRGVGCDFCGREDDWLLNPQAQHKFATEFIAYDQQFSRRRSQQRCHRFKYRKEAIELSIPAYGVSKAYLALHPPKSVLSTPLPPLTPICSSLSFLRIEHPLWGASHIMCVLECLPLLRTLELELPRFSDFSMFAPDSPFVSQTLESIQFDCGNIKTPKQKHHVRRIAPHLMLEIGQTPDL